MKNQIIAVKNMKNQIIAVDYDETLVYSNPYGQEEGVNYPLINKLKELKASGSKLILWTCRGGEWLQEAVNRCKDLGLEFDAVNENINEEQHIKKQVGLRKVVAHIYIDDRAVDPKQFIGK
jgi:hydroxymethylpyrimidine pyrophosphatase-like HAD family hydrolase